MLCEDLSTGCIQRGGREYAGFKGREDRLEFGTPREQHIEHGFPERGAVVGPSSWGEEKTACAHWIERCEGGGAGAECLIVRRRFPRLYHRFTSRFPITSCEQSNHREPI